MQPATWTDERLDDLAGRVDAGFARVDTQMTAGFARVDADIRELRVLLVQFAGGAILGLIGVIAAILAT